MEHIDWFKPYLLIKHCNNCHIYTDRVAADEIKSEGYNWYWMGIPWGFETQV